MSIDEPPIPEGHVRVYTDHTGRWYEDIPQADHDAMVEAARNDPLLQILNAEIQAEIDREIVASIVGGKHDT